MRLNGLLFGLFAIATMGFAGCTSDDAPEMPGNSATDKIDDGKVSVRILVGSRAASALDPSIDRLSATRCDVEDDTYTLVSYHGRNKEPLGMVQVINRKTDEVVSEVFFDDARVNYCAFYNKKGKQVAYVGVDRGSTTRNICGIVAVPMKNGRFDLGEGVVETRLKPYSVEGVSVNCIKFIEQATGTYLNSGMVVASGGNNELADNDRAAGFTKFKINQDDPTILTATGNDMLSTNFRGYWISHNIESDGGAKLPVAYAYRMLDGNDLVYKVAVFRDSRVTDFFNADKPFGTPDAEVEVMRLKCGESAVENFGRFSVSLFLLNQGRFVVVSTGSKQITDPAVGSGGGVRVYRFDHNDKIGTPELCLVDVWDKAAHNTSNKNTTLSEPYIYASCGGSGVFKLRLDYYETGKKSDGTPVRAVRLEPVAKHMMSTVTESGTMSSANYVQCNLNMPLVHVGGGYQGYFTLDPGGADFVPCDPRTNPKP